MILRPRQAVLVERSLAALRQHQNTLAVAPTGSGKTVMLSAVVGRMLAEPDAKACVLAHRDELTAQNQAKFARVNPGISTSIVDADAKSWSGRTTFAMVPTLTREANLAQMPVLDLIVVDEAHHATAASYRRILDAAQSKNSRLQVFGVTATPNRGDGVGLRAVFSNVADHIRLGELIASGHLVRPRTFVVDLGVQSELSQVRRNASDFDMSAVEAILNTVPITQQVIAHWRAQADGRKTLVFCSTVAHAADVARAFGAAGIASVVIHGELPAAERKARLTAYERGEVQVVVNVAVLTEGYDYTPTSCIVLLRPSSHKSTLIQMVGRGLRTVDPAEHPHVDKTDCVVLDFGTASLMHGRLEEDTHLDGREPGAAPTKECPNCAGSVPLRVTECPLCGYVWEQSERRDARLPVGAFAMTEIDLLSGSNFSWVDLFGAGDTLVAAGFESWAGVFGIDGRWYALGAASGEPVRLLAHGDRLIGLAKADDWLNAHEAADAAHKTKRWLGEPPTDKQLAHLPAAARQDFGLTRYQASAHLCFRFNRGAIQRLIWQAHTGDLRRAA